MSRRHHILQAVNTMGRGKTREQMGWLEHKAVVARNLSNIAARKTIWKWLEPMGYLPYPTRAVFEPTMRCNLHCDFCYQNEVRTRLLKDLPIEAVERIMDNLLPHVRHITLIGGEIFAYKPIFDVFELIRARDMTFSVVTNGTLFTDEKLERLRAFKGTLTSVGTSLDGMRETHNRIRGSDKAFDSTVESLRALADDFELAVNMVLVPANLDEARLLMTYLAEEVGPGLIMSFQTVQYATQQEVDATRELFGDLLLPMDYTLSPNYARREDSPQRIRDTMQNLRQHATDLGMRVMFYPPVLETDLDDFWNELLEEKGTRLRCGILGRLRVNYHGQVNLCTYIRPTMGSLTHHSLTEVWNSPDARRYRRTVMSRPQLTPLCKRCCRIEVVNGANRRIGLDFT